MGNSGLSGRAPFADYAYLVALYESDYLPNGITKKEFCLGFSPPLPYGTTVDGMDKAKKKSAVQAAHERNKPMLLAAQQKVREALDSDDDEFKDGKAKKAEFALKVFEKVFEREEPSPELAQAVNIIIPPLFAPGTRAEKMIQALTMDEEVPRGTIEEGERLEEDKED